jgi:thioesterase domain-containing protein
MSGLPTTLDAQSGARLEAYLHAHIPLVRAMQVRVAACDASGLTLAAPLAPNINHEGSAFGGSLAGLATLTGWGLVWLLLEPVHATHIVVSTSQIDYLRPVTDTLAAHCPWPGEAALDGFRKTLARRGKVRITLHVRMLQQQILCARFSGDFVAYHDSP